MSFEPIDHMEVVTRALAQRGRGVYKLGGGALFTAADAYSSSGNRFPGFCDCTGLAAYAAKYQRGQWNTDAIVDDAWDAKNHRPGPQKRFSLSPDPRPGDFIITGRGHDLPDHCGVVVEVLPGFKRGTPKWWEKLRIAHCSGSLQFTTDPATGHVYGATRVQDAYRWRNTGYIIRPHHVTPSSGASPSTPPGSLPPPPSSRIAEALGAAVALVVVAAVTAAGA